MVATVLIRRLTGAGPTATDITSLNTRANTTDDHTTDDTAFPIQIPTDTGTKYSFWVSTRLDVTVAPDTLIDNVEWFTDGANSLGTGVIAVGETATDYTIATGTAGDTGDELTTGSYTSLNTDPTDIFAFTSASPKAVVGSKTDTGQFGDRFIYQTQVTSDASPGATGLETITWRFDET